MHMDDNNELTPARPLSGDCVEGVRWGATVWLPCQLTLDLPVPAFTVGDLLRLQKTDVIDTKWSQSKDIPLRVNGKLIAWTEFDVVGERLAVRLTDLT